MSSESDDSDEGLGSVYEDSLDQDQPVNYDLYHFDMDEGYYVAMFLQRLIERFLFVLTNLLF